MSKNKTIFIGGKHPVFEIIKSRPDIVNFIICTENKLNETLKYLKEVKSNKKAHVWDSIKINALFDNTFNNQGIACNINQINFKNYKELKDEINEVILFEEFYDVRNIGSIIRTGLAFGIKSYFFNKKNTKANYEKILKASAGYAAVIDAYEYTNLATQIENLKKKNFWCIGLDNSRESSSIYKFDWPKNTAIVLGNEHFGIKKLIKSKCDFLIKIPISKNIESLNVSNALAITLAIKKTPRH